MKHVFRLVLLVIAATFAAASAHAQEKVMREGQVTQEALIDALAPTGTASAADGIRTRSFRPSARPARASILVTFVTNSSELTVGAKSALDVLAAAMKSDKLASVKFTIEGHADPRGGDELNMRLSQARADSVLAYLTGTHGLSTDRVNAVGKGSSALMNPSEPAAPENRRVTIVAQPN